VTPATDAPRRLPPVILLAALVAVAGFGVRLAVLLATDGLRGSSAYDDGVYFAAAASFAHGRWPYADFLFLQPPAVVVAGAPFAALGSLVGDPTAVVIARLVWIGIGAASCALVAVLAGRRSLPAGVIAGAIAATFFPLAYGERSTLLEPLATLLLLVAMLVRDRGGARAALIAGAIAGVSVDVKVWYVAPALVLAMFPPHRLRFLLGAVAGGAIVVAPFLIRAPGPLIRQVFLDQLGRPRLPDDTFLDRLIVLTGARWTAGSVDVLLPAALPVAIAIAAVVVLAAVAACWTPLGRRAVALLATTVAVLVVSPSFFAHYVAFTGPWTALVVGVGAGAVLRRIRWRPVRFAAALLVTAAVVAPTAAKDLQPRAVQPALAPIAFAAQRVDGCVRSDDPGLLAAIGVLSSDLARGCEVWPDVTGWTYDRPGFPIVSADRPSSPRWQRFVLRYLTGGDAVIVDRGGTGLSAASRRRIDALPLLARSGDLELHAIPR
jgi:alpha-1,2-mannosyltransferase